MIPSNAYSSCKLYRLRLTVLMGRNGAGDPTSSPNIGEEYQTSERMVNAMFVYILNCHGEPLMPCQPRKARLLLQEVKAKVVRMVPFTIQLLYGSSGYKQEVSLGIDAGTHHIGVSATTDQQVLFEAEVQPRSDIGEVLATRRQFRRARRSRSSSTSGLHRRCAPGRSIPPQPATPRAWRSSAPGRAPARRQVRGLSW